jgi:hypothetical protein
MSDSPVAPEAVPDVTPYHLVLVVEGEPAELKTFADRGALLGFLGSFEPEPNARVQLFIFRGVRLLLSSGSWKYVLEEGQPPEPIFSPPSVSPPSQSGDWFDEPDADEAAGTSLPFVPDSGGLDDDPDA